MSDALGDSRAGQIASGAEKAILSFHGHVFRNGPVAALWQALSGGKEAGLMAHYQFQSEWALTAPVGRVFELACHPENFSVWWPSVKASELLEEGDADGVGTRAAYTLRSPLLYSMRFVTTTVEVDRPSRIHTLVRGDLVGTGTYHLEGDEYRTLVRFVWNVSTAKTWMNLFAPVARPLFVWAHQHVMLKGAAAMAKRLDATLLSAKTAVAEQPAVNA